MKDFIAAPRLVALLFGLLCASFHSAHAHQAEPSVNSVSRYDLTVKILAENRRIEVAGTCRLPATAQNTRELGFYLSPKMQNLSVKVLEPKLTDASISLTSEEEGGDTKWTIKTKQPILAGQSILIQFSYLSEARPAPQFKIGPEGSFVGGGGELWYPQIAFKNRDVGMLRFKVPAGETVFSSGVLESTSQDKARGEFTFRVTRPLKFAFASGKYTVTRREGAVRFNLFLLRPRKHAPNILEGCAKALDFLTRLFGKFPYEEFSLVEVDFPTVVRGTSEFGAIFVHRSKLDEFDLSYWAHELGHQWWGLVVKSAPNTPGQMMLSEGVTQFGGLLAVEAVEGQAAADEFRRNGYRGKGQSARHYFKLLESGPDLPLTAYIPKNQNEILRMHGLANSKGFILLDMLSRRIGRERFAAILRRFIQEKANQPTSWQEFQRAIEAGTQQDVHWFFEQWFEQTGAPDYQLSWKQQSRTLQGVVSQATPYFRATLEVEITGSGHRALRRIEVIKGETAFKWRVPFKIDSVVLDPHYKVLRCLPEFQKQPAP